MTTRRSHRRGYFSMPGSWRGRSQLTGRGLFAMLLLLGLATLAYLRFILPGLESLQCGATYAVDLQAWIDGGSVGDAPACVSSFPTELQRLEQFMVLLLVVPLAFVVVRQRGNLLALPALALVQIALWLAPSPPVALAVGLVGVAVACLPVMARGWVVSVSHIGGLVLWPSVALAVVSAADSSTLEVPGGLSWLLNLAVFGLLPGMLIISPITGAREIGRGVQTAVVGFFAVALLILLAASAWAAADGFGASDLTDADPSATVLTPAAQSGTARMYAGYANQPAGAFVYSFLQSGGVSLDVHWSSVRGTEATFTTPDTLPSWTNPGPCTGGAIECGHLAIAVPVVAPPGRPEEWILGGAEEVIDDTTWHGQHGGLSLHGHQYYVILTDAGDVPAGAEITLRWPLPWDGTGAAALAAP